MKKKLLSLVLAFALSSQAAGMTGLAMPDELPSADAPTGAVEPVEPPKGCEFNFSAAKYVVSEADERCEIAVVRQGSAEAAADVVFKAVDVYAVYGEDYTILDEDDNPLEKASGTALPPDTLKRLAESSQDQQKQGENAPQTENADDIFGARNVLLGVDSEAQQAETEQVKDEVQEGIELVNQELTETEGVSGVVHFSEGETEKSITVLLTDNAVGSADKTVLLALLGATEGSIAPNATSSLTIMDDEEYTAPVFEMADTALTLDAQEPQKELMIRRVSGEAYYSTVLVSTYSMTAKADVDFKAMNNQQVVFAPGETEKTVSVEALQFTYSGDFGVRLTSDGSCEIADNDRAIVKILGERKEAEEEAAVQTQSGETGTAPQTAANVAEAAFDGTLGTNTEQVKDFSLQVNRPRKFWDSGRVLQSETVSLGGNDALYLDFDKGFNGGNHYENIESIKIKLKYKRKLGVLNLEKLDDQGWAQYFKHNLLYGKWDTTEKETAFQMEMSGEWATLEMDVGVPRFNREKTGCRYTLRSEEYIWYALQDLQLCDVEVFVTYKKPNAIRMLPTSGVTSVPYINLNTSGGSAETDAMPGELPVTIKKENGEAVTAIYRTNELLYFTYDRELAAKQGRCLAYVSQSDFQPAVIKTLTQEGYAYAKALPKTIAGAGYSMQVSPYFKSITANVHLKSPDGGETRISSRRGDSFTTTTGAVIEGSGYAGKGKAIVGYAVYATYKSQGKLRDRELISVYRNSKDLSKLGGDGDDIFYLPCPQSIDYDALYQPIDIEIEPLTEFQGLEIKPHPSTKSETIYETVTDAEGNVSQREVTYGGRAYLDQTFSQGDQTGGNHTADDSGRIYFDNVNSGSIYTLHSIAPLGYLTEWVNGTMDYDEDGQIDNDQLGDMSQETVDTLYTPVYGSQFVYQVNQVNPKYYYRFTKFDPARLLNGQTRVGYVKEDKRTILEYDGSKATYGDLQPVAGAQVQIGENTATTDDAGKYEIKMDGVPDAVRVSAAVKTGNGTFITHALSNASNNIIIPMYDTFEPVGVTAAYEKEENVTSRGIKIADMNLTVTVKVKHMANNLYIKQAEFLIKDSAGKTLVDCNEKYDVTYTDDGTYGYATLKFNPKKDMIAGNRIFVQFVDQNDATHRAMDLGHHFIEQLNLKTFILGAIGSTDFAENDVTVDLLDSAMFDLDLGQISGFNTTTRDIEPDQQYFVKGKPQYVYDATLTSYYKEIHSENFGGGGGSGGESGGGSGDKNDPDAKSIVNYDNNDDDDGRKDPPLKAYPKDQSKNSIPSGGKNGPLTNSLKNGVSEPPKNGTREVSKNNDGSGDSTEQAAPETPKNASVNNQKKTSVASTYNFELTPSIKFDLVTTARTVKNADGSNQKDKNGKEVYKHYFEEMSLGVGLAFDVQSRVEISLPLGISVMIKPSLTGSVQAVYYLKTNYTGDPYWNKRPIEYTEGSFGLFKDYGDNMYRAGYISLNPSITIDVGVKVAIVEVDVGGTFNFDMDFKFDNNNETRNYGSMEYDIHINLLILNFTVYKKELAANTVHMFGEDKPIGDGHITSTSETVSRAVSDAFLNGDTAVKPAARDYLEARGGWEENEPGNRSFLGNLLKTDEALDEDNPADSLLQSGVMPGGDMASAMLSADTMFAAYVDDDPARGDNDRSCVYYTYTEDDGSWAEPLAMEDDGTMDKEPVVYDMGDSLLVAWLSADKTFDGSENSMKTVSESLNALNVHAAFFDKATKSFGEVYEVTKTTEKDAASDGNIVITKTGNNSLRVYYTKTQYQQDASSAGELLATSSVIAYRDYEDGAWSESYTEEEQLNITAGGNSVDAFTQQWYGQRFADARLNGRWPVVTDLEADYSDDWQYFAFVADEDGSYGTTSDRRIYLTFAGIDKPVCVTPEAGAYDDLQFCYSGEELILAFKTDRAIMSTNDGAKAAGGISYINLSEVFEKQTYTEVENSELGCYEMAFAETAGFEEPLLYQPEDALVMDGPVQKYELFADRGGRMYLLWTDNELKDDGTSSIQLYASAYNGNPEWTEAQREEAGMSHAKWSAPVLLTSPMESSYNSFTAQSVSGDGIAIVAKRTNTDDTTQLVFHLREPYVAFGFNEALTNTKYVYEGQPVELNAQITNTGLQAVKTTNIEDADGVLTWKAQPGKYHVAFERLIDGEVVETLGTMDTETVWDVGDTLQAFCEWTPEELPDNMDLRVMVTDVESGEELCGVTVPVVKRPELDLGQLTAENTKKNEAKVTFSLCNNGNLPAHPTAVVSALSDSGEKTELLRAELEELLPLETAPQELTVPIEEQFQTIAGGKGSFRLAVDILEGEETVYTAETEGGIYYSPEAMEAVSAVEGLEVEQTSVKLKVNKTAQLVTKLLPETVAEDNKVKLVSSDESVATVTADGSIKAVGSGKAVITAYAIPKMERISVMPDGSTQVGDMQEGIPDSMIKQQEIKVSVTGSGNGSSSGGASKVTVTFDAMGGSAVAAQTVTKNTAFSRPSDPVRAGYVFEGWFTDEACTKAYDFDAKVTEDLTLYAKWSEGAPQPVDWNNPFTDVKESDWFYDNVRCVCENKLFSGVSDSLFAPNEPMTRAMLVTVLYRAAGSPDMENQIWGYPFADVDAGSWYGKAVYWARMNGIVKGYSNEEFAPDQEISREQIAAILVRYTQSEGGTIEKNSDLSQFDDTDQISDWAMENIKWAVGAGLISGKGNGILDPLGNATRAEVAAILQRLLEK